MKVLSNATQEKRKVRLEFANCGIPIITVSSIRNPNDGKSPDAMISLSYQGT